MAHKYWEEDTEQRHSYFEKQFLSKARERARERGMSLSRYLSQIKDFESFKRILADAWDSDASLLDYFNNMADSSLLDFYQRNAIQKILNEGKDVEITKEEAPTSVRQVKGETIEYVTGYRVDREGIKHRAVARKFTIKVKNRQQVVYRDRFGRFVRVAK